MSFSHTYIDNCYSHATAKIEELMRKHNNATQADLANILGIKQPQVSNKLKGVKSRFTLEELAAIADYYSISLNDLLGIPVPSQKPGNELANILSNLFEIDNIFPFEISTTTTGEPCLSFNSQYLSDIFKTWDSLNKFMQNNSSTLKAGLEAKYFWKNSTIATSHERPIRWNFRNESEQCEYIVSEFLDFYNNQMVLPESILECFEQCVCEKMNLIYYSNVEELLNEQFDLIKSYLSSSKHLSLAFDDQDILAKLSNEIF